MKKKEIVFIETIYNKMESLHTYRWIHMANWQLPT